jgi:ABC-2 type transport system ATP-binding protein
LCASARFHYIDEREYHGFVTAVIETEKLTKVYEAGIFGGQDVHALKDLDLQINKGEIFGYLGPNGSGKTTTIKMLLGLIFPTSGTIRILGTEDIGSAAVRQKIGYLPEGAYYPDFLKGEEVVKFYGRLYGMSGRDLDERTKNVLGVVGMTHARKRLVRGYSKGMRQRIGLAQALISDPEILILDEPTTGLDPLARKEIRDILSDLRDQGKTLMISSHELAEVELISNRVAILYGGVTQVSGTVDELLSDRDLTIEAVAPNEETIRRLNEKRIVTEDKVGGRVILRVPPGMSLYDAMELCKTLNLSIIAVAPKRESLEELFVRTVGEARGKELAAAPSA